jgi:CRP-like cAMP-binding protein
VAPSEFRYQRGEEVYGEGEPAEFIYQIIEGAVRSFLQMVVVKSAHSIFRVIFSASKMPAYIVPH